MKTVGIIGGFGPEATAQFYQELVVACRKTFRSQPSLIIRNVPLSKQLENDVLLNGKSVAAFIPLLTQAACDLKASGAELVVLPCNTLHVHAPHITRSLKVPFISIIKSTVRQLQRKHVKKAGLLGTLVTVKKNLFAQSDPAITFVIPPPKIQKGIDRSLHVFVTTGNAVPLQIALNRATGLLQDLGINEVVAACTDFHGLIPPRAGLTIHDTVDILVQATVDALRGMPEVMV